ncbi:auxin-responsive protein SAUR32-like [Primulina tabacum]|uniref:auxin-responsive protein SAUR32-like n=1 Tax=Primulina tabacum TaxID=48773 RepID=UPI003F59C040
MKDLMHEKKKMKVKKGCLKVWVGLEDEECQGFMIPISYLYHPIFKTLLERTRDAYGYEVAGPLKLPCSINHFHHLRGLIEKERSNHRHHIRDRHTYLHGFERHLSFCALVAELLNTLDV